MTERRQLQRGLRIDVREAARELTRDHSVHRDIEGARRAVLRLLDEQLRRLPPADRGPVACRAGCSLCCHLRVMVTPVEVFGLIDFLRSQLPKEAFEAFRARVADTFARLDALEPTQLLATNIPCPVLVDGRCSAYAARPLNCRAYHSLDLEACQRAFDNPLDDSQGHPQYAAVARVHEAVQGGFVAGQTEEGFDSAQCELVSALCEALDDPEAEIRYKAGKKAFLRRSPM